jgi:hypothetical protein
MPLSSAYALQSLLISDDLLKTLSFPYQRCFEHIHDVRTRSIDIREDGITDRIHEFTKRREIITCMVLPALRAIWDDRKVLCLKIHKYFAFDLSTLSIV